MSYAFDPELASFVPMLPTIDISDVSAIRTALRENLERMGPATIPDTVSYADADADGVPIRIYTAADRSRLAPALIYLHGGGFVLGDLDVAHAQAALIAAEAGIVVISVDYRLAPEYPFPAGLEDCYTVLAWAARHAADLDVDAGRIGVGGESAGGGLTASLTQLTRARRGPAVRFQYLGCPELDDRLETQSTLAFVDTPMWNRPSAELSWKYYISGQRAVDGVPAAPAREVDLSGLPPAFVWVNEFDPLRDEGLDYAQRLVQAGVSVELHLYAGTFHASSVVRDATVSRRMSADIIAALRRGLSASSAVQGAAGPS